MEFNELTHEYIHNGQSYISVTQLLKKYNLSTDYTGIPANVLNNAAQRGKAIHKALELYINGDKRQAQICNEVALFERYIAVQNINLSTAKAEEMHYDSNYLIAGTIDFQYEHNGERIIADFKTTSTLHLDVVAWQLSIYNYLVSKGDMITYYFNQLKVFHFTGGKLHIKDVYTIDFDEVKALLDANLQNLSVYLYTKTTKVISDTDIKLVTQILAEQKAYQDVLDQLQSKLDVVLLKVKDEMIKQKDYRFTNSDFSVNYISEQTRRSLDQAAVKTFVEAHGGDIKDLMKESITKDSLRIKYLK